MCFGSKSSPPPATPPPPTPGVLNVAKVAPDPAQADKYRGFDVGANTTGRYGGGLLLDAAANKPKATLGGT